MKRIVFWGGRGHAKVLREFAQAAGYELVALFDNDLSTPPPFPDVPLLYGREGFRDWWETQRHAGPCYGAVAIGGARGRIRFEVQEFLEARGVLPATLVHPTAFVARDAVLGKGTQILANVSVCVEVTMGPACILNTACSVDHESVLGAGVHVAPGARLAGCVTVGDYSMIGTGAVVLPRVRIGRDVVVGAGAVVTRDVPDGKIVYGNPARVQRDNVVE